MKKLLLITLLALFVSCSTGHHPDFEANVASVQKLLELLLSEQLRDRTGHNDFVELHC